MMNHFFLKNIQPSFSKKLSINKSKDKKNNSMRIQQTSFIMSNMKQYKENIALMHYNRIKKEHSSLLKLPKITTEVKKRETAINLGKLPKKKLVIISSLLNDSLNISLQTKKKASNLQLPLCYSKINKTPRPKYAIPEFLMKFNNNLIFKGLTKSLSNSVINKTSKLF